MQSPMPRYPVAVGGAPSRRSPIRPARGCPRSRVVERTARRSHRVATCGTTTAHDVRGTTGEAGGRDTDVSKGLQAAPAQRARPDEFRTFYLVEKLHEAG